MEIGMSENTFLPGSFFPTSCFPTSLEKYWYFSFLFQLYGKKKIQKKKIKKNSNPNKPKNPHPVFSSKKMSMSSKSETSFRQ